MGWGAPPWLCSHETAQDAVGLAKSDQIIKKTNIKKS